MQLLIDRSSIPAEELLERTMAFTVVYNHRSRWYCRGQGYPESAGTLLRGRQCATGEFERDKRDGTR